MTTAIKEKESTAKDMGMKLKVFRVKRNLSQGEFAKQIGIRQQTVSELEKGRRLISTDILLKIKKRYAANIAEFF